MNYDTHNGSEPWHDDPTWKASDYHKVSEEGIGIDRTTKGTNAVSQYHSPLREELNDLATCPDNLLLWFHRVGWDYKMKSGRTLWEEMVSHYYQGVNEVTEMKTIWASLEGKIDQERFAHTQSLLDIQENEAKWWRDACVLFFGKYSKRPVPANFEKPKHTLEYYQQIPFPYDWDSTLYFKK